MIKDGRCFFETFIQKNGLVYANSLESNGLFVIEKNTEARLLAIFPKEKAYKRFLFADCICYDNQIVFAPESAEHIYIYDTETKQFEVIEFDLEVNCKGYDATFKFSRIIENERFFYFMPATYPYILRMDKETRELKYIPLEIPVNGFCFRKQYARRDREIYMVSLNSSYILKFDTQDEGTCLIQFSDDNIGGMSVHILKDNLWIVSSLHPELYRINLSDYKISNYRNVPQNFTVRGGQRPFACGFEKNGKLILVPMGGNIFLEFNCEREEYVNCKIEGFNLRKQNLECIYQDDEKIVLFRRPESMWYSSRAQVFFDIKKMTVSEFIFKIDDLDQYNKSLTEQTIKCTDIIRESFIVDVRNLINLCEKQESINRSETVYVGKSIYNYLSESIGNENKQIL